MNQDASKSPISPSASVKGSVSTHAAPSASVQVTSPANTVLSGGPNPATPPQFRAIVNEVVTGFSPSVSAAKVAANTVLNDAKTGIEGLIDIAAGDAQRIITDAEARAIPFALGFIPKPVEAFVAPFASVAIAKRVGPINHAITDEITLGLGMAHNWLETLLGNAEGFVAHIGEH